MYQLRVILGAMMAFAGLACYGAGGYTLYVASDPAKQVVARNLRIAEACRSAASTMGVAKLRDDNSIEIDLPEVSDARNTFGDMMAIQAMCPFQKMVHACVGTGCAEKVTGAPKATMRLGPPKV